MSMCRGCLVKEADMFLSLFSKVEKMPVEELFYTLTGLSVSRDDGLPRYICQECYEGLLQYYRLRETMLQSDEYLRSLVEPTSELEINETTIEDRDTNYSHQMSIALEIEEDDVSEEKHATDEAAPASEKPSKITESITIQRIEPGSEWAGSSEDEHEEKPGEKCALNYNDEQYIELLSDNLDESQEDEQTALDNMESENVIPIEVEKIFCCGCTGLQFTSEEELRQHSEEVHKKERIANNLRPYECNVCYKRYINYARLEQHQSLPYREKKYACKQPGCNYRFLGRSALMSHTKSKHIRERTYVCELCQKSFFTSSTLLSHRKTHTDKQLQCKTCFKMFLRQPDLLAHQITHSDERPFSCDRCDKRFKSRNHLRDHRYVHTGERRLKCGSCDERFTTYLDRRVHQLCHDNIHPYKCSYCDKIYKRNFKLQVHIRKAHTKEQPYGCDLCPQRFFQNWELTAHRRMHDDTEQTTDSAACVEHIDEVNG